MYLLLIISLLVSTAAGFSDPDFQANGPNGFKKLTRDNRCQSELESSSLTYLVDTTGSMADDHAQLKLVNSWLLDRVTAKFPCGVRQYTMVEYNDPGVGPVRVTASKEEFNHFFTSLKVHGGGDCPELAMAGLKLALLNSPAQSFILVLTDASALDYNNKFLVDQVFSLIKETKSQVVFLITGLCGSQNSPDFLIYRDVASLSFGHVFVVPLSDLNKVLIYLDHALSVPVNYSTPLFSGDFHALEHSDSFLVNDSFASLMITTDGPINMFHIDGPMVLKALQVEVLVSEPWGSVRLVHNPPEGDYTMTVRAGGVHAIRVQGFTAVNISSAANCSACHSHATCEESFGSVECSCIDGFIGDGFDCTDIDECAYPWTNNCTGICFNTEGSFMCSCPDGYNSVGKDCIDIDECSSSSLHKCHPLATCVNEMGSYSCVCPPPYHGDGFFCEIADPCTYHTNLEEPWRSSSNAASLFINCDSDKNGWYRFIGGGGIRIPETCVPEYSCNTDAPMWMNGLHPAVGDGIVSRTACASWRGDCCSWTSAINVKACPGGYHVYELNGTPACALSYCTDPLTSSEICQADEEWKLGDKGHGCYCKDEFHVSSLSDMIPKLTCTPNNMIASFQKCQMKQLDFNFGAANIKDNHCFNFNDNNATNTFSVLAPLQAGSCGVQSYQNGTHVIYGSSFLITADNYGVITRNDTLTVSLSCAYELDMMTSLNQALRPIISNVNITVGGTGQFTATMALFKDSDYRIPYEGTEVVLSGDTILYIGVVIQGGDSSKYALVMRNCYATPTQSADDELKYYIIRDSCPNTQDKTINVLENGVSRQGRVSVQMFKFIGDYDLVYLHCAVSLCEVASGTCEPACGALKREITGLKEDGHNLRIGPIIRSGSSFGINNAHSSWALLVSASFLMLLQILEF